MEIKENISATLRREMDRRGLNFMEFSAELGIPRSTLQGYLKGSSSPRADTLEELAKKLGISPAELVAGEERPAGVGIACLDPVLSEIPLLHPLVRTAAQNAASILEYAFLLSGNLNVLDEKTAPEDQPDAEYRYCLYGEEPAAYDSPNYGIHMRKRADGDWENIAQVAPFTSDRAAAMLILHYCTKFQLSLQRVLGIVHDFMAEKASNTET